MNTQPCRTVLIVEDCPEDREMYRRYLLRDRDYDYTIVEASFGNEGLNLWRQHQPDAVLLDYQLPDLDGLEFLAALPTQQPLPIVMMTGVGSETIAVQAIKAGAQDYLVKGQITPESLKLALDGTIKTVQLQTQLQERIDRERVVAQIAQNVSRSLDLDEILHTTVIEVRQFLQTDRVVVFQVEAGGNGSVVAESVGAEWRSILSEQIYDPCFVESYVDLQRQGRVTVKADIYDGSIDPCHVQLLAGCQVRANLVVPILHDNQFWGVLIAHHCAAPRQWKPLEIDLLQQLSTQVSVAIRQAELYQQAQTELAERKRTEEVLRSSEERLRLGLQAARMGTWDWNMLENQITWSANMESLFGLAPGEFDGSYEQFVARLHPEDRDRVLAAIAAAMTSDANYDIEFRVLYPDGTVRWALSQGKVFYDASGQAILMSGVDLDITALKQLEAERLHLLTQEQLARQSAETANRAKDDFLSNLSHELRNPLTAIIGWAQLIQAHKLDDATVTRGLATIYRSAKAQSQLVEDMLDLSRINSGKLHLNSISLDLVPIVNAAIESVQLDATAKSISIGVNLAPTKIMGDDVRLEQVVLNLLTNAIKFTPPGGRIEIALTTVGTFAQLRVSDTGKGIQAELLPYIFDRFRQGDASSTKSTSGLGLGLSIVQNIVELHGGTVRAESAGVGQGTTIFIALPLATSPSDLAGPAAELPIVTPAVHSLAGLSILAVDDEVDILELMKYILENVGAEVTSVTSAQAALATLVASPGKYDVLLADIGMPEEDGFALIRQVRDLAAEAGGQIPAAAVTAYVTDRERQLALDAGFQVHLAKPIDPVRLIQVVANLTGRVGMGDE